MELVRKHMAVGGHELLLAVCYSIDRDMKCS